MNPSKPHIYDDKRPTTVLIYPSLPVLAPRHHENLCRIFDAGATNIFNTMELPVTQVQPLCKFLFTDLNERICCDRYGSVGLNQLFCKMKVPLGLSSNGLPLGLQIVGGHGNDLATLVNLQKDAFIIFDYTKCKKKSVHCCVDVICSTLGHS